MQSVAVIDEMEAAVCALQPLRVDLLKRLASPASASSLARDLGVPRQKLNYHLNALQGAGLVHQVEERRKGNCVERVLQAKARSFVVGPSALGELGADPAQIQDRFSWGYLVAVCAKAIRQLGSLRTLADASEQKLATLTLETEVCFESAEARSAFANEMATAFCAVAAKYHKPNATDARSFRVFTCAHPTHPNDIESDDHE